MSGETVTVELRRGLAQRTCDRYPGDDEPFISDDQREFHAALSAALQHQGEGRVERLERELVESDEALRACEEAHGAQVPGGSR